jgi:hypothetical protein
MSKGRLFLPAILVGFLAIAINLVIASNWPRFGGPMPDKELLDNLPLWSLFPLTVAAVLLAVEGGHRLGAYRHRRSEQEKESPVGAMVAATLGLLAFMLAFTFGLAATRYDTRRELLLDEANAIGTAYLRAELLVEPERTRTRKLLRQYVDARLEAAQDQSEEHAMRKSEELHGLLWAQAVAATDKDQRPVITALYIKSLNEVIDLHSKRVMAGFRSRIPTIIWLALYGVALLGMGATGYQAGLSGTSRSLAALALVLAFSGVMYLIADLDRPREGLLTVNQQAMVDLQKSMRTPAP